MSLICAGSFSSVLKVVANQPGTVETIKRLFDIVSQFIGDKNKVIEPTLVGLSSQNIELGDWILSRLVDELDIARFASLIGKIVVCDQKVAANRLELLLENIVVSLQEITSDQ
jgi:hypothetical protein